METATLRYRGASRVDAQGGTATVRLQAADPILFAGEVHAPRLVALGLLAVAANARDQHHVPAGTVARAAADPVITTATSVLRLESFSACNGVHARLDLLPEAVAVHHARPGTTNVDVNPPMRAALARLAAGGTARLEVTHDALSLDLGDDRVVERQVPLPPRWVRGFAEVPWASARLLPHRRLGRIEALRFLRGLPAGGRGLLWAVPAGSGLRLSATGADSAVPLDVPARLRTMRDLAQMATGMVIHRDPLHVGRPAVTAWQLDLPGARYTLVLSPTAPRGFSGEGGILTLLAQADPAVTGHLLNTLAPGDLVDDRALATRAGASRAAVRASLAELSAAGRLGYDLAASAWHQRTLPFARRLLERQHPRLVRARQLVASAAVELDADGGGQVRVDGALHRVHSGGQPACTCPWVARHGDDRGPCAHQLAVLLARRP